MTAPVEIESGLPTIRSVLLGFADLADALRPTGPTGSDAAVAVDRLVREADQQDPGVRQLVRYGLTRCEIALDAVSAGLESLCDGLDSAFPLYSPWIPLRGIMEASGHVAWLMDPRLRPGTERCQRILSVLKYDLDQERGFFRLQGGDVRPEVVEAVAHLARKTGAHHQLSSAIGVGRKIPDGTELARSMDLEDEYRLAAGAMHGAYYAQAFLVRAPNSPPSNRMSLQLAPLQCALIAAAHAWRAFADIAHPSQVDLVAARIEAARAVLNVAPELFGPQA